MVRRPLPASFRPRARWRAASAPIFGPQASSSAVTPVRSEICYALSTCRAAPRDAHKPDDQTNTTVASSALRPIAACPVLILATLAPQHGSFLGLRQRRILRLRAPAATG